MVETLLKPYSVLIRYVCCVRRQCLATQLRQYTAATQNKLTVTLLTHAGAGRHSVHEVRSPECGHV